MDWSNIERDVALKTSLRGRQQLDLDESMRPGKITKLIDGILSSRLLTEDKSLKENSQNNIEVINQHNPLMKTLLADLSELQSSLRAQATKLEQYGSSSIKYDHDFHHIKKNQDTLFSRINQIEAGLQGKSGDADAVEMYGDMQLRLKRVESNLDGLEEHARSFQVQYATKDAFAKLLDTIFDQLRTLSATVELSKEQCTHASVLFDALASAFVLLNGEDSGRHQLELVTSFSREINKDHLSRVLTDALMRSVDGSIQAHLKPAMGLMHSSLLELIDDLREKQDSISHGMRNSFQQLTRQIQEDRSTFVSTPPPPPAPTEYKLDEAFLAEFTQMKERMEALSTDNQALRTTVEGQSAILSDLVSSHETTKTLDAEQLLKLKTHGEDLERNVFILQQECAAVRTVSTTAESAVEELRMLVEEGEQRVTTLEAEIQQQLVDVVDTQKAIRQQLDAKAAVTDLDDACSESKAQAGRLKALQDTAATKEELDNLQVKFDVLNSDLNILQDGLAGLENKHQGRLKGHEEDIAELRRRGSEAMETASKLSKRLDQSESTAQSKMSALSTELYHKVAENMDTTNRVMRRLDALDTDAQEKNVTLRETQTKVHSNSADLSDLIRKVNLLDSSCTSQLSSLASQQKALQEENLEFSTKFTRKVDLHEAEILAKFNIRNDRVDVLLAQTHESLSKMNERVDYSEHKQQAALEEATTELRSKVTATGEHTAQLTRRLDAYQEEVSSRVAAVQADFTASNKAMNERINAVIKQADANLELLQTQFTSKHNDLSHKVSSVGDSLSHLAQQQFELSSVQEKQQMDFNSLSSEVSSTRSKLEEKLTSSVSTFQSNLAQHSKAHQSALGEQKYDLIQITSRVALVEQLIRYGQDLEDQALSMGGTRSSSSGSPKSLGMGPRPADPDVRNKLAELRGLVDGVCTDLVNQRVEFDTRLDAFKVSLSALRNQYEEEVSEIKESSEAEQRKVSRCEQTARSLQSQIDILQVEVQSLGEEVEKGVGHAAVATALASSEKERAAVPAGSAMSPMHSPERGRVLPLMTQASPSAVSPVRGGAARKAPSPLSSPAKSGSGDKDMPSPVHQWLAKRKSTIPYEPTQGVVYTDKVVVQEDNSFDDEDEDVQSNEGSDVFPVSSPTPTKPSRTTTSAADLEDSAGVIAFSPGSVASPPPRNNGGDKLSISTTAEVAAAGSRNIPQNIPSTPDSPWDKDSDEEEEEGGGRDQDDTSSVDSEVRGKARSTTASEGIASPTNSSTSAAITASTTSSNVPVSKIPGPSISSISSQKSPVKLSGSLLRSGRTSSLGFGSSSGYK